MLMDSLFKGMKMGAISSTVKARLQAPVAAGINTDVVPFSSAEGQRDWNIQQNLSTKNFMGNVVTRSSLPGDPGDFRTAAMKANVFGPWNSQKERTLEQRRQMATPWLNHFMPAYANRLNNPAQAAFIKQPQLAPPNTYGQWYAFMHAMSAAFGTLQGGS